MKTKLHTMSRRLAAFTLAVLLAVPTAFAAAGDQKLQTSIDILDGLTYRNTVTVNKDSRVESFSLELSPDSREVEPIFLQASGTAYGAGSINLAVSYAQSLGYHVLGAINTDFFAPSTGVPLGISIEDGIYKSSPEAEAAVVITDGEVELVEQPQVTLTLTNESTGGQTVLTHLNKYRADSGGLYLFNYDFSTVSTHTSTPGWMVRMELTDPDDTLSVSGRLELEVTELLRTDTSVVIGENEYILTAADAGGLESVFQSFQVGDRVSLHTDCTSSTLEDAQWASGVGDVMVRDGQITDSTAWTYVEKGRDPRSALGVREDGTLPYLYADGKTQVTVEYDDGKPVKVTAVVVSSQHSADVELETLRQDIIEKVIKTTVPAELMDEDTVFYVNPTGRFVVGGPHGDSGLTGRKIIVDTYGGYARHGGGAFSGKDPTKVDRSAAYAARWVAKNLVAAGLADKCEVELAYAIGVAKPVSVMVDTQGTGKVSDDVICDVINKVFDLRPSAIIERLNLRRPIYRQVAAYGHMGREELNVPWEQLDMVDKIKACL